jgi:hypothetical protein
VPHAQPVPQPPYAEGTGLPWDVLVTDAVAAIAAARARHGDTFAVRSGSDRYLFTFSPTGVESFYSLPEDKTRDRSRRRSAEWQGQTDPAASVTRRCERSAAAPGVQQGRCLGCRPKELTFAPTESVASFGEPLTRHVQKRGADASGLLWELRWWRPAHRRFERRWVAGHSRLMKERRGEYLLCGTYFDGTPAVFLTDPADHVAGDAELRGVVIADTFGMTEFGEMCELVGDTVEARRGEFEPQGVEIGRQ